MARLADQLKHLTLPRIAAVLAVTAGAALVLAWLASAGGITGGGEEGRFSHSMEVRAAPFTLSAHFTGQIVPGDQVEIVAPFDGAVTGVHFAFGDQVAEGDLLISFDPADIARTRAEAEAAWLRAEDAMTRIETWDDGADMRRARRALESAETDLNDAQRRLEETAALFERGLVARNEYEGVLQQERSRRRAFTQAQEELAETRRRGEGTERRIAYLERELARVQLEAVETGASMEIRAPSDGVIVRPGAREADDMGEISLRVSRGQVLGVIASANGLGVRFHLDEGDLGIVSPGQTVTVTGPGFDGVRLTGRVSSVSGQADRNGRDAAARFAATIRLDRLGPDTVERVRIGMTAHIEVVTYQNQSALIVPIEAVRGDATGPWLMVADEPGAPAQRRNVELGRTSPSEVEVASGLEEGEIVVWN
jgi:HlyD family secretion protein